MSTETSEVHVDGSVVQVRKMDTGDGGAVLVFASDDRGHVTICVKDKTHGTESLTWLQRQEAEDLITSLQESLGVAK